ncbi:nucleotidyltransferase domain-containing protein [Luteolibacter ambystomatis]|uniref:Nucleotidyltransferase domain-containing protein n=1 Tax=Luteolibacter ambystomatis TaxID=2824561 RepID=A0A975IZW6_9BACT|nr:nucleotidyltransferase domain-containing protein [Luteolibacter ambystomatis]QUE50520.1 nucleotidyltransferase domain-containing protein [Luteolibacter ambystomatis]
MTVEERIAELLDRIEREQGFRILYACESGSRAWGFASPDSDYDIRFLFVHPEQAYLAIAGATSAIDLPIVDELDAGGWDVRKAEGLLGKSNGALLEWLHSPIVYRAEPGFLDRWRATAREVFSPRGASDHYRGLAKQMWLGKLQADQVRAKDYLYALRATLAAKWILEDRGIPPVAFAELLPVAPCEVQALVPDLLKHKAATNEGQRMARLPVLDAFLEAAIGQTDELPDRSHADMAVLDRLFLSELRLPSGPMLKPEDFTLERVRQKDLLLFDTVAGSHAYGTAVEGSDEDRRGVFVAPSSFLFGLDSIEQVADERNDEVYYELGRFVELLLRNNPNVLELLASPDDCIRHRHPLFDRLKPELFLSKLCAVTFGEYAMGQIRKARGLNKKIVNPQPEQRIELLKFCHVPEGQGSLPVEEWLALRGLRQEDCGLTALTHASDLFAIYHDPAVNYRGIVSPKDPDALHFSSVPKDAAPIAWMTCNRDAFRAHCKAHREYWEWVANRNEERYRTNAGHGRGYDSKNLLHTLRLLDMAEEIAREGVLRVRRPNRDFLLRVRSGEFEYDELVEQAEQRLVRVREAFEQSTLPDEPDRGRINTLLVELRREFEVAQVSNL